MTNKTVVLSLLSSMCLAANALSPVSPSEFFKNISYSPDIQPGVWSGRSDLCMKKAKETGYPMFWFLTSLKDEERETSTMKFLEKNICGQKFCDLVNSYKYLILCCEDYSDSAAKERKDALYECTCGKTKIYNENTGTYVPNWRGYPAVSDTQFGKEYCDPPPSLHLLKIDSTATILFHVYGAYGKYDKNFSPYQDQFPIPYKMNQVTDAFAPWLKNYLDMFPVAEQIEEYENSGGSTQQSSSTLVTNYIYNTVEIAVTETVNPTVYQIALHRDNVLFRSVTTVGDILVKRRIDDVLGRFDERTDARNHTGKWFVNHDDTLSAIVSEIDSDASIDVVPSTDCTFEASQRFGNGFTLEGYEMSVVTNVYTDKVMTGTGVIVDMVFTNVTVDTATVPFLTTNVNRNCNIEIPLGNGRLYRVSVEGNSTFDVFSTK